MRFLLVLSRNGPARVVDFAVLQPSATQRWGIFTTLSGFSKKAEFSARFGSKSQFLHLLAFRAGRRCAEKHVVPRSGDFIEANMSSVQNA